jgi:spore germination protein KC
MYLGKKLKTFVCAILAVSILLSGGCQSARELNELVIVMGIGMDSDEETQGNIRLTAQIVLPEKISTSKEGGMSSGSEGPYYNLDSSASNTFEAVREYTHMISGKLYTAHAQIFIIGRKMAEQGFAPYLDFFVRAKETRPTAKIVISETTASDVLGVKPKMGMLPATSITKLVEGQGANSQSKETTMLDYVKAMQSSTFSLIVPITRVEEKEGEKIISVSGMAVFKKDKMVGELSEDETRGVLWVRGEVQSTAINVEIAGGVASFEVLGAQSKVSPVVSEGKIVMKISVSVVAELAEQTCKENLATPDNIKKLQALVGESICGEIVLSYNKAAALHADVFGFGDMIHQHNDASWHDMEPNWDKLFPEITLDIKTDVSIKSVGSVEKPVWDQKQE